ncbi:MAG: peptide-methionine (S)-S-oxide reductase [Pelagibacteraceae bacterium]|nr:peptide-methionine (S)-S-oxide reductase [Pelagibacteraceae bacterium]
MNKAIFAAGCFWCIQEIYDAMDGVTKTTVGYIGGNTQSPTYEDVCTGDTNHAEAIEIEYDETIIKFETLLNTFWEIHDPTTLNRQGPDIGTQYRSAIFYTNEEQRIKSEESKKNLNINKFNGKIVTEITKATTFYPAEEYHQHYNLKMKKKYGIS